MESRDCPVASPPLDTGNLQPGPERVMSDSDGPSEEGLQEVRDREAELRAMSDLAWRHSRAVDLASQKARPFEPGDDRWVRELTEFLVRWNDPHDPAKYARLSADYPDLFWAVGIHLNWERSVRFHIEALVTAGADRRDIASRLGVPESGIAAFEACFYDIRPYLDRPGGVLLMLYHRIMQRGVRDLHPDAYWKLIALESGVAGLDRLWRGIPEDPVPGEADLRALEATLRRLALAAARTCEVTAANTHAIIAAYFKQREFELCQKRAAFARSAAESSCGEIGRFIHGLLKSIEFRMTGDEPGSATAAHAAGGGESSSPPQDRAAGLGAERPHSLEPGNPRVETSDAA